MIQALAKTLTVAQLGYLKEQFEMLSPSKNGYISMQNYKMAVLRCATNAMKDSRVMEFVNTVSSLQYRKMDFEEFCAASISVHQLEAMDSWEHHARRAYELFEKDGNRSIIIEELASELGLSPSVLVHVVLQDWIRHSDGKLSFLDFVDFFTASLLVHFKRHRFNSLLWSAESKEPLHCLISKA